jgi:tetratricopeptide (TPR) repeat protein
MVARLSQSDGGCLSSPSPEQRHPLSGHLVVFTGKLSSLGRRDARGVVEHLGGSTADEVNAKTTMLVVGGEGFGPAAETSNKLRRAEELNAQRPVPIQILPEEQFCRLVGLATSETWKRQYSAMRDLLARYRLLREDHIRYLVKCGIIQPAQRTNADTFFGFADVAMIKQANDDMTEGASFQSAVRNLLAQRVGQMTFDFRLDAAPAKILTLQRPAARAEATRPPDRAMAEEYFRAGSELDDGQEATRGEAAAAYRKALELDPYLVAALINLANIHYSLDELVEAQALYERAIGLESDFFEAHFNLGNIYHDLGRYTEAQRCYVEALRLNPSYADTHFYLAVTLEKMGSPAEARPHWRAYQQLAPQGEWVELAKEFSD